VLEYFRRDFHPDDHDLSALVAEGLRRAGITPRAAEEHAIDDVSPETHGEIERAA
jgi:hypothetical protein